MVSCLDECDSWLLLSVLILCLLGTLMVFSAASFRYEALNAEAGHFHYLLKHLSRLALGVGVMLVLANLDYRHLNRKILNWGMLVGGLILVVAPLVLMGLTAGDCTRWFNFFGLFPVQPVEFVKVALILFMAERLTSSPRKASNEKRHLLLTLLAPCFIVVVLALQPNFGNVLVISLLTVIILFMAGASLAVVAGLVGIMGTGAALGVMIVDKLQGRVDGWLAGLATGQFAYQVDQSLISLGAGGLVGQGFGASHQRFWFLPEGHTDFIISVVGEELGLLGTFGTIALFMVFAMRGLAIARRAGDSFGRITAIGLTSLITLYVIANIGMATGLLPVMGLPLPFVSYGGSALVTNLAAVGILLSIDRQSRSYQKWRHRWQTA
jgi:cell division protein FtsW